MPKLTDKTIATTADSGDFLHLVDVSDTTSDPAGTSKRITAGNLVTNNTDVVANTAKVSADGSIKTHSDVYTSMVPTDGQVLTFDDTNGWQAETPSAGGSGVFESATTDTVIREAAGTNQYNRDFVIGSSQLDHLHSGSDTRMFFDISKGAFRAGNVTLSKWDDANRGYYSCCFGSNTIANGDYSLATGNNTIAAARSAQASGQSSYARKKADDSHASGVFATIGDAQTTRNTIFGTTSSATSVSLGISGNFEWLTIEPNTTQTFVLYISARQTGGTAGTVGDSAGYKIEGVIKNTSGTVSLVGSINNITLGENAGAAGWSVTATAASWNDSLSIDVTGEADKTIHWVASVQLTEVG